MKGGLKQRLRNKRSQFGIIPTMTAEAKAAYKAEQIKKLKEIKERGRNRDSYRFNQSSASAVEKSPTAMKLKNTYILQNNNPSFDAYAEMMKKRKSTSSE